MTLPQYYRTAKGNQALENRSVKLTSRQRALLLMIENGNASHLSQQQFQQLATADNLAVLLEHQLITSTVPVAPQEQQGRAQVPQVQPQPVISAPARPLPGLNPPAHPVTDALAEILTESTVPVDLISQQSSQEIEATALSAPVMVQTPEHLSFDEVKQLMMRTLREYCGLLASALIKDIQHASSVTKLRMCQVRWVTTLTETRASSAQIAAWVEQINYSLNESLESPAKLPEVLTL